MNFVLNVGHLGRREPVVHPATPKEKEVAREAHTFGVVDGVSCGGDDGGYCSSGFCCPGQSPGWGARASSKGVRTWQSRNCPGSWPRNTGVRSLSKPRPWTRLLAPS